MGMIFTLGTRWDDPVLELNAENIYASAIEYGCDHRTAARLVQAIMKAEEETVIRNGGTDGRTESELS